MTLLLALNIPAGGNAMPEATQKNRAAPTARQVEPS